MGSSFLSMSTLYTSYHAWTPNIYTSHRERERCKMEAKAHNSLVRNVVGGVLFVTIFWCITKWGHPPLPLHLHPKKKIHKHFCICLVCTHRLIYVGINFFLLIYLTKVETKNKKKQKTKSLKHKKCDI